MKLKHVFFYLSVSFLFSCGDTKEEAKKELKGPHAQVQLIYFGTGERGAADIQRLPKETETEILSDSVLTHVLVKLGKERLPEYIKDLRQQISVKQKENTDLIEISFYHEHSDYAIQVLETLVEVLNEEEMRASQKEAKGLIERCDNEIDSIAGILKESPKKPVIDAYEMSLLLERYAKNDGSVSEAEKKELKKIIESNSDQEKNQKENHDWENLEKTYIDLLEQREELQIKIAGYVPRIKMVDRPRWVEK